MKVRMNDLPVHIGGLGVALVIISGFLIARKLDGVAARLGALERKAAVNRDMAGDGRDDISELNHRVSRLESMLDETCSWAIGQCHCTADSPINCGCQRGRDRE